MNGEGIRKISVLAPAKQHEEIWTLRMTTRQTISAFYVQAAEEKLEKIRKRVKRATQ